MESGIFILVKTGELQQQYISFSGKSMYLQWLNCIKIFVKIWAFRVGSKYATLNAHIKGTESLFKNDPLRIY
jgi:hypothetical protein